jgi:hypothetical protein
MIPYTVRAETAKINIKLKSTSVKKPKNEKGIMAHPTRLRKNVKMGAKIKLKVLAFVGITDSFTNNFKPSASGCNNPKNPTELGP